MSNRTYTIELSPDQIEIIDQMIAHDILGYKLYGANEHTSEGTVTKVGIYKIIKDAKTKGEQS